MIRSSHNTQLNKANKGESNRKLPKMFAGKNLQITQKKVLRADLIKKGQRQCVRNRCMQGR